VAERDALAGAERDSAVHRHSLALELQQHVAAGQNGGGGAGRLDGAHQHTLLRRRQAKRVAQALVLHSLVGDAEHGEARVNAVELKIL